MTSLIPSQPVGEGGARAEHRLGVVGIGVSLLTYALAMAAPELPPAVIAVVIVFALACFVPMVPILRRDRSELAPAVDTAEMQLKVPLRMLADDCRHLAGSLSTFRDDRRRVRPRRGILGRGVDARMRAWQAATVERYEREFRSWAIEVFDEVLALGLVSASARRSVAHPNAAQVEHLPELFENAARRLEQASR